MPRLPLTSSAIFIWWRKTKKAREYFIEYIEYAPLGRYAINVLNTLQSYNLDEFSFDEKVYIANAYYENGRYRRSLSILDEIPFEASWVLLVKNYDKLNDYDMLSKVVLKVFPFVAANMLLMEKKSLILWGFILENQTCLQNKLRITLF